MRNDEPVAMQLESRQRRQTGIDYDFLDERAKSYSMPDHGMFIALELLRQLGKVLRVDQQIMAQRDFDFEAAQSQVFEMAAKSHDVRLLVLAIFLVPRGKPANDLVDGEKIKNAEVFKNGRRAGCDDGRLFP